MDYFVCHWRFFFGFSGSECNQSVFKLLITVFRWWGIWWICAVLMIKVKPRHSTAVLITVFSCWGKGQEMKILLPFHDMFGLKIKFSAFNQINQIGIVVFLVIFLYIFSELKTSDNLEVEKGGAATNQDSIVLRVVQEFKVRSMHRFSYSESETKTTSLHTYRLNGDEYAPHMRNTLTTKLQV